MPPPIPIATYRLQLSKEFDFDAAAKVVPYLKVLGISHVYVSPFMKARAGSTHGYDVVDHNQFNPELGGEAGFAHLSDTLGKHDLGLILDFVPNHVGVNYADNLWWLDMLEWGPASPHAASFDVDWEQLPHRARGGILLPILGASYGQALEQGEIELRYDQASGSFSAWYFEHRLPISPERYSEILRALVKEAQAEAHAAGERLLDLASRYSRLHHPNREEAPIFKTELRSIEGLRTFPGVHGTTGYEWLNAITQVLIMGDGLDALDEVWHQLSNRSPRLEPVLKEAKRRVLETLLASEFTVLSRLLARIASGHYSTRDFSANSLRQALGLYVLHFPVYRTYLTEAGTTAEDRALIVETVEKARREWFAADEGIFDFLRDVLTMDLIEPERGTAHSTPRVRRFALKVQQFTGPLMAKSLEDTAFYRYHRQLALNEVGGNPAAKGLSVAAFHTTMQARSKEWPHGMTATATHDTK